MSESITAQVVGPGGGIEHTWAPRLHDLGRTEIVLPPVLCLEGESWTYRTV